MKSNLKVQEKEIKVISNLICNEIYRNMKYTWKTDTNTEIERIEKHIYLIHISIIFLLLFLISFYPFPIHESFLRRIQWIMNERKDC